MRKNIIITQSFQKTRELGKKTAKKLKKGALLCLVGDLGSGKTTFAQGLLRGLGVKENVISPTFLIMKNYKKKIPISLPRRQAGKSQFPKKIQSPKPKFQDIYHIDTYRVDSSNLLDLGWEEIISNPNNIVIIEWADRIRDIIPENAIWIEFKWIDKNEREIKIKN